MIVSHFWEIMSSVVPAVVHSSSCFHWLLTQSPEIYWANSTSHLGNTIICSSQLKHEKWTAAHLNWCVQWEAHSVKWEGAALLTSVWRLFSPRQLERGHELHCCIDIQPVLLHWHVTRLMSLAREGSSYLFVCKHWSGSVRMRLITVISVITCP